LKTFAFATESLLAISIESKTSKQEDSVERESGEPKQAVK